MEVNHQTKTKLQQLSDWYGDGTDGSCPTAEQWQRIFSGPSDQPIVLVNFFKLRATAQYQGGSEAGETPVSGEDAFGRYAATSVPTLERVGGQFLHVGPVKGTFLGEEEDWDLVAIGRYPNAQSFFNLYIDAAYRKAFAHRTAACETQKVLIA